MLGSVCYNLTDVNLLSQVIEQVKYMTDGGSLSWSLGAELANIILTDYVKVTINQFKGNDFVKLYKGYAEDTLLVIKKKKIDLIMNKSNSFDTKGSAEFRTHKTTKKDISYEF